MEKSKISLKWVKLAYIIAPMKDLIKAAARMYKECVELKKGESVLVITDGPLKKIGYVLWKAAVDLKAEAILTEIIPRKMHGTEPPSGLEKLMREVDVLLIPTSRSMTHTKARKSAAEANVRGATLPGITEDMMRRTFSADYKKISKITIKLKKELSGAKEIKIISKKGTNLTIPVIRSARADTGMINKPGLFSNLPAGEAFLAPEEGKSSGVIVVDGSMSGVGRLSSPITIEVKKGFAENIKGREAAAKLNKIIKPYGKLARNIAEFGIGTNYKARLSGNVLEDEKVLGTIHVAIGSNHTFGGKIFVPVHLDGIVTNPSVFLDGRILMKNGKLFI